MVLAAIPDTPSKKHGDRRLALRSPRVSQVPLLLLLFLLSLFLPLRLQIGTMALYPSRILLIFLFVPVFLRWARSTKLGSKSPDIFIIGHVLWAALAMAVVHGIEHIQAIGIYTIEVIGTYFLGRTAVRSPEQFRSVCLILVTLVAFTIPFAAIEGLTGNNIIVHPLGSLSFTAVIPETRLWGLYRAYAVFGHPILYGIVSGSLFCLCYYVISYRKNLISTWSIAAIPAIAGFLSLSSAAFVLISFQTIFIVWDFLTRSLPKRWVILTLLVVIAYFAVDVLSSRLPIEVFISYFSMDPNSAYTRLIQMEHASKDLMQNWVFGIGFNEWDRPSWLGGSIDNFWLVVAMRYGIPGIVLLLIGYFLILKDSISVKITDPQVAYYRRGYCILLITMGLVVYTVHLWDEAFYLFVFFLGCRSWLHAPEAKPAAADSASVPVRPTRSGLGQIAPRGSGDRRLSPFAPGADRQPHQVPKRRP